MSDTILGELQSAGEGFTATIRQDASNRVYWKADGDIDADGANGQAGAIAAYRSDNKGSELLANGGMGIRAGKVVFIAPWGKDIVMIGSDGQPLVLPNGVIPSLTWYRDRTKAITDPSSYVDAETVPYMVVPQMVIQRTQGAVRGCLGKITNTLNGKWVIAPPLDKGPRTKIGELSIAAARAIGLESSPRHGGTDKPILLYEIWPGKAAPGFVLQPS